MLKQRCSKVGWCLRVQDSWVRWKKIRKMWKYFFWYEVTVGTFIYQSDHSFINENFPSKHSLLLLRELEPGFSLENHPSLWFIPCGFDTLISSLNKGHMTQAWPVRALHVTGMLGLVPPGQRQLNLS